MEKWNKRTNNEIISNNGAMEIWNNGKLEHWYNGTIVNGIIWINM